MIRKTVTAIGLLLSTACGGGDPGELESWVTYWERRETGYELVYFYPDNGCRVELAHGEDAEQSRSFASATCTEKEREFILALREEWEDYTWATSIEHVPGRVVAPPEGESSTGRPPESGIDYAVGTVRILGNDVGWINVDEAGEKEMKLVEFFRGLYIKYGGSVANPDDDGPLELAPEVPSPGPSTGGSLPDCSSGTRDGTETDVDCGGPCEVCVAGDSCKVNQDCATGLCQTGMCAQ